MSSVKYILKALHWIDTFCPKQKVSWRDDDEYRRFVNLYMDLFFGNKTNKKEATKHMCHAMTQWPYFLCWVTLITGSFHHRPLNTKSALSSCKRVSQIVHILWPLCGAWIMISSPCFSQKKLHLPFPTLFTTNQEELIMSWICGVFLPSPILCYHGLYLAVSVVQTHPATPYQPIPFHSLRHHGGGLPVFHERKLGRWRGETYWLNI